MTVSGSFTDPGFTHAAAGTAETFTVTINWGDGTTERVQATVTQGSAGTATTGTFSAQHLYATGGRESDLGYHRLVRGFLATLCRETRRGVYCAPRARFARYEREVTTSACTSAAAPTAA